MLRNSNQAIKVLLILSSLRLSAAAQQQTITGKAVGVSDGDTITALDDQKRQYKVRLEGIDAPESNQDFGSRAKQSLSDPVFGKTVTVTISKKDRYGRTLGKVTIDIVRSEYEVGHDYIESRQHLEWGNEYENESVINAQDLVLLSNDHCCWPTCSRRGYSTSDRQRRLDSTIRRF